MEKSFETEGFSASCSQPAGGGGPTGNHAGDGGSPTSSAAPMAPAQPRPYPEEHPGGAGGALVVQRAPQVTAVLLPVGGPDSGLWLGWGGPAVQHHQPSRGVAPGCRDGTLPAFPRCAPEAAAKLCSAGHELRAKLAPDRAPEKRRPVRCLGSAAHRPGASHLWLGVAPPGAGQWVQPRPATPQRHVPVWGGAAGLGGGHSAGRGWILLSGLTPEEADVPAEATGQSSPGLHHLWPDERTTAGDHLQHGQPHLKDTSTLTGQRESEQHQSAWFLNLSKAAHIPHWGVTKYRILSMLSVSGVVMRQLHPQLHIYFI